MQDKNSVGIVQSKIFKSEAALLLDCGRKLENYELVYETYGSLNQKKDNAILVCHALSGNHHLAGYYQKKTSTLAGGIT